MNKRRICIWCRHDEDLISSNLWYLACVIPVTSTIKLVTSINLNYVVAFIVCARVSEHLMHSAGIGGSLVSKFSLGGARAS